MTRRIAQYGCAALAIAALASADSMGEVDR